MNDILDSVDTTTHMPTRDERLCAVGVDPTLDASAIVDALLNHCDGIADSASSITKAHAIVHASNNEARARLHHVMPRIYRAARERDPIEFAKCVNGVDMHQIERMCTIAGLPMAANQT